MMAAFEFTATLLQSGKVLAVGGANGFSGVGSAELLIPGPNTWTYTGALAQSRSLHTATLQPNGKVIIAGGAAPDGTILASVEVYDPSTRQFASGGNLPVPCHFHTSTLLNNGRTLIAGGKNTPYDPTNTCQLGRAR